MIETDLLHLALLFAVALIASTIDAMAGGGGLLTLPALMATGLDPVTALATNKFQGTFGSRHTQRYAHRVSMLDDPLEEILPHFFHALNFRAAQQKPSFAILRR